MLADEFGFRQLHFHFPPGSLSFLRAHQPDKFGDRMDDVRYTIVATNAEEKRSMGFETGRVFSGIRGVIPMYAFDEMENKTVHVGALEAGTSFSTMLSLFHDSRPWIHAAVLLEQDHLERYVWPNFLEKLLKEEQFTKKFCLEATTSPDINRFLDRDDFAKMLTLPGHHLLQDGEFHYSVTSLPLRDFRGEQDPAIPDAGLVLLWQDVSKTIAAYHSHVRHVIFWGFFLFIAIELIMSFALDFMTKGLKKELKETQENEAKSLQARQAAEEASRLKTEFLGTVSHELKTPLNAIVGLGQMLSESPLDKKQQNFIDKINLSSESLLGSIDNVLLITEIEATEIDILKAEKFNPTHLANRLLESFTSQANDQGVMIRFDSSESVPKWISGFPSQLEKIVSQLLDNAIKFSLGKDVVLSLRLCESVADVAILEFAVTDHGIGMSQLQQEEIFLPFKQGDGSKSRIYGGMGLGLTIARKICRQLGGDIAIESILGQGSRFSFSLKYDVLDAPLAEPSDTSTILQKTTDHLKGLSSLPPGGFAEINSLLDQLEEPLTKLQPRQCQELSIEIDKKNWPDELSDDIWKLTRFIEQYRFAEARQVVAQLKEKIAGT